MQTKYEIWGLTTRSLPSRPTLLFWRDGPEAIGPDSRGHRVGTPHSQTKWDEIWGLVKTAWDTFTGAIQTVWDTTLALLFGETGLIAKAIGFTQTAWETITGLIETAWDTFNAAIQTAWDNSLGKLFGEDGGIAKALEGMKNIWNTVWTGIKDTVKGLLAPIQGPIDALKSAIDAVKDALRQPREHQGTFDQPAQAAEDFDSRVRGGRQGLRRHGLAVRGRERPRAPELAPRVRRDADGQA